MARGGGGGGNNRPRGGKSGKSNGGGEVPREVIVSKKMSWVLRHGAVKEGLKMDEAGYVGCGELLALPKLRSLSVTFAELRGIVASNDKQRFQLIPLPSLVETSSTSPTNTVPSEEHDNKTGTGKIDPSNPLHHLIRASQGHSLPIASSNLLTPLTNTAEPSFPVEVVHGTYPAAWSKILASGGLKRMGRTHVHFATGLPSTVPSPSTKITTTTTAVGEVKDEEADETTKVISGMRKGASMLIWVDVKRSLEEGGLKWWRSENGVVLTEGDEDGVVRLEWVKRVVRRGTGEVLWVGKEGKGKGEGEREA